MRTIKIPLEPSLFVLINGRTLVKHRLCIFFCYEIKSEVGEKN